MSEQVTVTRLFSRQTMSATLITPKTSPEHSSSPSPAGSRSRANSYDMECFKKLLKNYEETGNN